MLGTNKHGVTQSNTNVRIKSDENEINIEVYFVGVCEQKKV